MNNRNIEIDVLKGLLVAGMVLAHTIQFLDGSNSLILKAISNTTDLVSFSGFLACFGFAVWRAYLSRARLPWGRMLLTALKCYVAFALSGMAFRRLVSGDPLDTALAWRVLALRDIPGYSEFIIAFALAIVLSCVAAPAVRFLVAGNRRLAIFSVAVLLLAQYLRKTQGWDPLIGLFLGGGGYFYYPVILYLPIFLFGAWMARSGHRYALAGLALSAVGAHVFMATKVLDISIDRFPPAPLWLICSASLAYLYYGAARLITAWLPRWVGRYLNSVGHNVLFYLLLTNLALFVCHALGQAHTFSAVQTLLAYGLLMGGVYFLQFISVDLDNAGKSLQPKAAAV